MELTKPSENEVELSVFGRGFGEAIVLHLGHGKWMLVDSCLNPKTRTPAGVAYLQDLGVALDRDVALVIATHWHDDHVQGIGDVVEACSGASVVCSAALQRRDIVAFVLQQERASGAVGSGVDEFRRVLRVCSSRDQRLIWAKANQPLHPVPPGDTPTVVALSPSENAFARSIQSLIQAATSAKSAIPRRYEAPEGANGTSVVSFVRAAAAHVLLGADLECTANPQAGWDAILSDARPTTMASAVKVPHHGSVGAHHSGMWSDLLEPDCLAILTPWVRGAKMLPTQADLERLVEYSNHQYITALPSRVLSKKKPEKMVRRLHDAPIEEVRGWGHVRARRGPGEGSWRVELAGDAVRISASEVASPDSQEPSTLA
jgi:hypothetical protein